MFIQVFYVLLMYIHFYLKKRSRACSTCQLYIYRIWLTCSHQASWKYYNKQDISHKLTGLPNFFWGLKKEVLCAYLSLKILIIPRSYDIRHLFFSWLSVTYIKCVDYSVNHKTHKTHVHELCVDAQLWETTSWSKQFDSSMRILTSGFCIGNQDNNKIVRRKNIKNRERLSFILI